MTDVTPDGRPHDAGEGAGADDGPQSTWWPWPEAADSEAAGPRDGVPGAVEAATLPAEIQASQEPDQETLGAPPLARTQTEPQTPGDPRATPAAGSDVPGPGDIAVTTGDTPVAPEGGAVHEIPAANETPVVSVITGDALSAAASVDVGVTGTAGGVDVPTNPASGAGDLEPPKVGTDKVGSIPAVSASHTWAKGQWSNWRLHLVRFVSAGLSVLIAVALVPGLSFTAWRWGEGLEIALIFAVLNAFVKPMLQFVALRFLFSSYGIVIVLINTALLLLLSWIMDDSVQANSLIALLVGGALIGLIGGALDAMMGANYPMLDRDYKERNGLP